MIVKPIETRESKMQITLDTDELTDRTIVAIADALGRM